MKNLWDYDHYATLVLSNCFALIIVLNESCDGVMYQYSNSSEIKEAEIEYIEDVENATGYADDEDGLWQPAFTTGEGVWYFLGEFIRNNVGGFRG